MWTTSMLNYTKPFLFVPWCDLDHKANVKGQIMFFHVNASPEPLDVAGALTV